MFIDSTTGKRVNIDAPFTAPDGRGLANLRDPAERERYGVVEIPDPTPPSDFSDETYYRTEQDDAPYVVYTRKPDEMIASAKQAKVNAAALAYLTETDWYVTRQMETGVPVPAEVLTKRQGARDAIHPTSSTVPAGGAVQEEQVVAAGDSASAAP